jgi:uncharacterized protein (DUF1810 family)
MTGDRFDLQRFVDAQAGVYERVLAELRAGHKASHWMWFVFPQIAGLGFSPMAQRYAISGRDEARAYDAHAVLGARLRKCTEIVNAIEGRDVHQIFGSPDDMKFRSCMTLFTECVDDTQVFEDALDKYFGGARDELTLERLQRAS